MVSLHEGKKHLYLKPEPKNRSSQRYIPISQATADLLKKEKELQQSKKTFSEKDLVFQDRYNNRKYILPERLYQRFKAVLKKAELDPELNIHSTRHTMATHLINSGVSIPTIQKLGGWSTPDVLLSVYAHTSNENVVEAVKLLEV